jgi:hypothetical protein
MAVTERYLYRIRSFCDIRAIEESINRSCVRKVFWFDYQQWTEPCVSGVMLFRQSPHEDTRIIDAREENRSGDISV